MPRAEVHAKLSRARTGKGFEELHQWMDEEYTKSDIQVRRHEITNIPKNIEIIRKTFGNDAVREFLYHIKEDHEHNMGYKMINALSTIKRRLSYCLHKQEG